MTFDFNKWLDEGPISLTHGEGSPESGGCWMSSLSMYSGEQWGDHPPCVCPVLRHICIAINDALSDEARGRIIGPRLLDPIGTAGDPEATELRRWILIDAAVRIWAPDALRSAGLSGYAEQLEQLPEVTEETAVATDDAYDTARIAAEAADADAADSASDAVTSFRLRAARDAAYDAARATINPKRGNIGCGDVSDAVGAIGSACAAARFDNDDQDQYVIDKVMPVLDRLLAVGTRKDVEMACSVQDLNRCVQRAAT